MGWVDATGLDEHERLLDNALHALAHRGPDGRGQWLSRIEPSGEQICFAHTRLAIIDPQGGAQPFHSADGRFVLTYNGEIYNFIELRAELVTLGHEFSTASDTEVLIEAYRAWGEDAFPRLRGMFAFAIYDRQKQRLVLARDHVGKKPLFIAAYAGGFAFASEIAALLAHPKVDQTVRIDQIGGYLAQRYVDGPATFYAGIRKLMPGHLLVHENGCSSERRYVESMHRTPSPPADWSLEESVRHLDVALREAVTLRMRSDAPYGLFLSGGLDSSVLLAMMTQIGNRPVSTFSVGFGVRDRDELGTARITARTFAADHHETVVDARAFADAWPACVALRGAPVSEPSDIAIFLLAKAAKPIVKMVLTGEGADELLAGYPKYWGEAYLERYRRVVPLSLHRGIVAPIVAAMPLRFERLKIASRLATYANLHERAPRWFSGDPHLAERLILKRDDHSRHDRMDQAVHLDAIRALQKYDFEHWLPDNLLERGDRMMMGGSIEGRMPFMDTELAKVALRIPERHLIDGRTGKYVLRVLARELLTTALIDLPKIGFTVPIGAWFRSELSSLLADLLVSGESEVRRLVDTALLDRLLHEHAAARHDHSKLLWSLANLELFLRQASGVGTHGVHGRFAA